MKTKEKSELLSYLEFEGYKGLYPNEIARKRKLLLLTPQKLYKYRSFDDFAEEMFEEDYAYLSSSKNLDDPFDCLISTNRDDSEIFSETLIVKRTVQLFIEFNYDRYKEFLTKKELKNIVHFVLANIESRDFCVIKLREQYEKLGRYCSELVSYICVSFTNISSNIKPILERYRHIKKLIETNELGILSLAETNNNKLLRSLYSDEYSGYCIEY